MSAPQMMPVQNRNVDVMSRMEADTSKTATSSLPSFKNQEPKFQRQRVKLIVEDVDSSGIAVPGTRVDLANCRDWHWKKGKYAKER